MNDLFPEMDDSFRLLFEGKWSSEPEISDLKADFYL